MILFIKQFLRIVLKLALGLLALVVLYIAAAFLLPKITVNGDTHASNDVDIYILTNGVHTDIVVPVVNEYHDWRHDLKFEHTNAKDTTAQYLALGWGDKGFYLETPTWADLKASVAIKAAFGLSSTAIHTTFYKQMTTSKSCKKISISKEKYIRLVAFIRNSFQKTQNEIFVPVNTTIRYGQHDAFYEAHGSYSLFHTCNTWANNALKSCGQKACFWTPFDQGIFDIYQ
jgi:uncharacterized protein (TIGR02117 family)